MDTYKVTEYFHSTNEVIERDFTDLEMEQNEKDKIEATNRRAAIETKDIERAAILERLGLTADEAKLLIG